MIKSYMQYLPYSLFTGSGQNLHNITFREHLGLLLMICNIRVSFDEQGFFFAN